MSAIAARVVGIDHADQPGARARALWTVCLYYVVIDNPHQKIGCVVSDVVHASGHVSGHAADRVVAQLTTAIADCTRCPVVQ